MTMQVRGWRVGSMAVVLGALLIGSGAKNADEVKKLVITNSGSDTMVNVAQAWADAYGKIKPDVSVEVSGGGSGIGIHDLEQGMVEMANCSREMTADEKAQAKTNTGKDPVEFVVGYDALAVYVNKNNPVTELTLPQLEQVYEEGGTVDKWSQLKVDLKAAGGNDEIVRVSRQNSSGTYTYFREIVLHKKDYKLGSKDLSGSKDVVELVGKTIGAIGYSGMGYLEDSVKFVKLAKADGEPAYAPSIETVKNKTYPLARPLYIYTLGQPEGAVKDYIDWVKSPAGQDILKEAGYVPLDAPVAKP